MGEGPESLTYSAVGSEPLLLANGKNFSYNSYEKWTILEREVSGSERFFGEPSIRDEGRPRGDELSKKRVVKVLFAEGLESEVSAPEGNGAAQRKRSNLIGAKGTLTGRSQRWFKTSSA